MAALTTTGPTAPAGERARAGGGAKEARARTTWLAGLYYLVAALAVTMWLWRDPVSRLPLKGA